MYRDSLVRLERALPCVDEACCAEDADLQARAVLAILVDRALSGDSAEVPIAGNGCPNCGGLVTSERSPYCGPACKEEAAFVRQMRGGLIEGTIFDEARQIALGEKLWHVLGGGYPRRQSLIFPKALEKVLNRADGLCETCGSVATTVDHIGSG